MVGGLALEVQASIGIALCPENGKRVSELIQAADVAMYVAKKAHSGFEFYSEDQHQYSPDRLELIGELRRAIDENELVLFYQPKIDLADEHGQGRGGARALGPPAARACSRPTSSCRSPSARA